MVNLAIHAMKPKVSILIQFRAFVAANFPINSFQTINATTVTQNVRPVTALLNVRIVTFKKTSKLLLSKLNVFV